MISRNLEKARSAFDGKDVDESRKAHDTKGYEPHTSGAAYLKSVVYGGLDGTITTFAVVAGVEGASLNPNVILILGFANLIADGIAMAFGDFLSTRAEQQYHATERAREEWEMENYLEGEKKELIELYEEKGISSEDATTLVGILANHPEVMVDTMMVVELGILEDHDSPMGNAIATFLSFAVFGFVPLVVFVVIHFTGIQINAFLWACVLTGATLFSLGALKSRFVSRAWWKSGLEILLLGGVAALAAYGIGKALESFA